MRLTLETRRAIARALYVIVELAERGRKLEAENADLRNELRAALERC